MTAISTSAARTSVSRFDAIRVTPAALQRAAYHSVRVLFALMFVVLGVDGFLHFIPMTEAPMNEGAMAFGQALFQTGYMFPLIKGTETLCGALLLLNRKVPLALVVLAPVVVNIFAFHLFLTPGDSGMAFGIVIAQAYLAWSNRAAYRTLLAS